MLGVLGGFLGTEKGKVEKKNCPFRLESIIVTVVQIRKTKRRGRRKRMAENEWQIFLVKRRGENEEGKMKTKRRRRKRRTKRGKQSGELLLG